MTGVHAESSRRLRPGRVLLTAGAVLGVACLVAGVVCVALGLRPLVFLTGSMGPAIPAGSLALAEEVAVEDLAVRDVVSVIADDGQRVTHRIVGLEQMPDGRARLTLRGDANAGPDRAPYVVAAADRVMIDVPWLGHLITWLSTPFGLLGLGAAAAGLVAYAFRPARSTEGGRHRRNGAYLAALTAPVALVFAVTSTGAWFDDLGTVTSGVVSTHTVLPQQQPVCQNVDTLVGSARLTWTQVDSRYEYRWELRPAGSTTPSASGVVGAGVAQGSQVQLTLDPGLIGTTGNFNVVVGARLSDDPAWVASTTTTTPVRRASVLILGLAMRCGHV